MSILFTPSIFSPAVATSHTLSHHQHCPKSCSTTQVPTHLIETRHRLISTSDLDLEECCLVAHTSILWALCLRLVGIIPSTRPSKDIFPLLPGKVLPLEVSFGQDILIWTSLAFETIDGSVTIGVCLCVGLRDCEDVATGGADWDGGVSFAIFQNTISQGASTYRATWCHLIFNRSLRYL